MEATLVIVTLLSLALALGMAIVTWRLLQEERQRADARVATLEEGLAASLAANPPAPALAAAASTKPSASASTLTQAAAAGTSIRSIRAAATADAASSASEVAEAAPGADAELVELHEADDPDWLAQFPSSGVQVHGWRGLNGSRVNGTIARANGTATDSFVAATADRLFTESEATARASERSRGVLAIGVGAGVVALILGLWSVGRLIAPGIDPRTGASGAGASTAAPLELVALQQTREGDALTIHGVVRNPHAGATVDRLAAVVLFFDVGGKQLASVRAPLDFRTLAPGDESPFQVTTMVPAGVARYRVSFRRDEGTIVPHIDRRQLEAS